MLESIYNIGSGDRTGKGGTPLARYLASAGGAAPRKPGITDLTGGPMAPFAQQQQIPSAAPPPSSVGTAAGAGSNQQAPTMPKISTDYSSDPALQEILSGGIRDSGDADAAALGAERGVLGSYGDRGLAEKLLGGGDPTLDSISDDPATSTSTLARLHRAYADTTKGITESDNQNNIFYGGHHIDNLANAAKDEQTQEADANASVHAALDQIAAGLARTKGNIAATQGQAESDAADRAAKAAILQALLGNYGASTDPTGGTGTISSDPPPAAIGGSQVAAPVFSDPLGKITPAQLEAIAARLYARAGGGATVG